MKIVRVRAIPMSDPVPPQRQHRTDLGTKVKSDATLILVETDAGLTGMGAALGAPSVVAAVVEHELSPGVTGEDPLSPSASTKRCTTVRAPGRRSNVVCRRPKRAAAAAW